MRPPPRGAGDTPRGSLATTCQEGRASWPLASTQGASHQPVVRLTPGCRGVATARGRRALQRPKPARTRSAAFGTGKPPGTLAALRPCGRRAIGEPGCVHPPEDGQACATRSRSLQDTMLEALAPAASWGWPRRRRRCLLTPRPDNRAKVELRGSLKTVRRAGRRPMKWLIATRLMASLVWGKASPAWGSRRGRPSALASGISGGMPRPRSGGQVGWVRWAGAIPCVSPGSLTEEELFLTPFEIDPAVGNQVLVG
jgi:hypothetical protein